MKLFSETHSRQILHISALVSLTLPFFAETVSAQLPDGLYALFHTSMGGITAQLYYAEAPMTVANFVGLTEGSRTWIEEQSGLPRNEPYFDGMVVNRVVPGFVVQTGSQNGSNADGGPGYTFPDEFSPALRHSTSGVVSMANSGLNSNGSQFFFTLSDTPWLDDVHSVFGQVLSGFDVLSANADLPLTNSKPIPDVVIHQVQIVRIGNEAEAFDPTLHGLPVVTSATVQIESVLDSNIVLGFETNPHSDLQIQSSTNLQTWTEIFSQWHLDNTPPSTQTFTISDQTEFFTGARVQYENQLFTPFSVTNTQFDGYNSYNNIAMDLQMGPVSSSGMIYLAAGGNTYTGSIYYSTWNPEAYRGTLLIAYTGFTPPALRIDISLTNATRGSFSGSYLNNDGSTSFYTDGTIERIPPP